MDVSVEYDGGVALETNRTRILLDPRGTPTRKPDLIAISHAHRDHYNLEVLKRLSSIPKLMTQATRRMIDPDLRLEVVTEIEIGQPVELEDLKIEAAEAGHVLGSVQYVIDGKKRTVYTGDFNLQRRVVLKPAQIMKSDVLIIESTYGEPRYTFPRRGIIYRRIFEEVSRLSEEGTTCLLAGRRLGTSQELTALLSYSSSIPPPMVHPSIEPVNRLYEEYGEYIGNYGIFTDENMVIEGGNPFTLIVPLSNRLRDRTIAPLISCTGWSVDWGGGIPLSSHADFQQIMTYVKESQPRTVYTVHGSSEKMAAIIEARHGISAEPVG